jgi:hypothetical protein
MYSKPVYVKNLNEISRGIFDVLPKNLITDTSYEMLHPKRFENIIGFKDLVNSISGIRPWEEVCGVQVLTTNPLHSTAIHIDGDDSQVGFNIPVFNCEDGYTAFYKVKANTAGAMREFVLQDKQTVDTQLGHYMFYEQNQVEEVYRTTYNGHANLINTAVPHQVVNLSKHVRIVVSVRWYTPLTWDQVDIKF